MKQMFSIFVLGLIAVATPGIGSSAHAQTKTPANNSALSAYCFHMDKLKHAFNQRAIEVHPGGAGSDGDATATLTGVQLDISRDPEPTAWRIDNVTHVVCTATLAANYKFTLDRQTYSYSDTGTWNKGNNSPGGKALIESQVKACITRTAPNILTFEFYGTGAEVGNVTAVMAVSFHPFIAKEGGGRSERQPVGQSACPAGDFAATNSSSTYQDRPKGADHGPDPTGRH